MDSHGAAFSIWICAQFEKQLDYWVIAMTASRQEWVSPGMDRNGRCLANEDLLFQDFTVESACLYLRKHFPWMTRLTKIANIVIVLSF
jgi:hypothetical protein